MNKKIKICLMSIFSFLLIGLWAFAFFSDDYSDFVLGTVGHVKVDLKNLTLSNSGNINPGDEDPTVPDTSRDGTEHKLEFDVENLGNKSVKTRNIITISTENLLNPTVFKLFNNNEEVKEKYYSQDGKEYHKTPEHINVRYIHYVVEGDALNGVGNDSEIEVELEDSKTHYSYNFSMAKESPNIYRKEGIVIDVEVQAMQYRNTNNSDWVTVFHDSINITSHEYVNGFCVDCMAIDYNFFTKPGLYDSSLKLISDFESLNIDVTKNYTSQNCLQTFEDGTILVLPEDIKNIGNYAFYKTNLEAIILPNGLNNIGNWAFAESSLKVVDINENTNIGNYAFLKCNNLKSAFIGSKNIGNNAFQHCINLDKLVLREGVININNNAFWGCRNLTDFYVPSSVKNIGDYGFSECGFKEVKVPNTVESLGHRAFAYCKSLECFEFPNIKIGNYLLVGCSNLKDVIFPNGITNIPIHMFQDCSSLESIDIPDSVINIGEYAFSGCKSLQKITLPQSLEIIDKNLFYKCSALEDVYIPDGVKAIYPMAFKECVSLKEIYIPSSVIEITAKTTGNPVYSYAPFYGCSKDLVLKCGVDKKPMKYGNYWNIYANNKTLKVLYSQER